MGWGVAKNGTDRDWATTPPRTSQRRSRAARAAGEFTRASQWINLGDSGIATLKLGGLDLVANRGAPFRAPAARLGRVRRPPTGDAHPRSSAANAPRVARGRRRKGRSSRPRVRPFRSFPAPNRLAASASDRSRGNDPNAINLHRRRRLAWQANSPSVKPPRGARCNAGRARPRDSTFDRRRVIIR